MFKFDRVNSSMLCMIRGKLCITIATAFTVTMATHLFLFMLFVDQQLIHGVSHRHDNRFPQFNPKMKSSPVKRDIHQPQDISGELLQGTGIHKVNKSGDITIVTSTPGGDSDINLARKILGNSVENQQEVDEWWLSKAYHTMNKLTGKSRANEYRERPVVGKVPSISQTDSGNGMIEDSDTKHTALDKNLIGEESDDIVLQNAHKLKEVIFQEVNIPPARLDDEWEAQDDWNMEHLIVAETKKSNGKRTNKQPDSKNIRPTNSTHKNGSEINSGRKQNTANKNIQNNYSSKKDSRTHDNLVENVPYTGDQVGKLNAQSQNGVMNHSSPSQRLPVKATGEQLQAKDFQNNRQRRPASSVIMGKLVKSKTKSISVVPKPLDAQSHRSGVADRALYRDNGQSNNVKQQEYAWDNVQNTYNQRDMNPPKRDYKSDNMSSRVKVSRDNIPIVSSKQDGRQRGVLTQQEIQHLHQNYVHHRNRQ